MRKSLILVPHQQSTGLYLVHRDNPDNPMRWLMPESVSGAWGFELVKAWYFVPGLRWASRRDGRIEAEHRVPGVGRFRVELEVTDECVEAALTVWNEREFPVEHVTSCPCWEFRNAPDFYGPDPGFDALSRAFSLREGRLTRLVDTDRRRSEGGVLPVYPVRGGAGPGGWKDRVGDGYGWGLSEHELDTGFVGLESLDGRWSTGTSWQGAFSVSFNTKPPWHGCIHSTPYLGTIPPGGSRESRGRIWYAHGGIESLAKLAALPDSPGAMGSLPA